jgi:hypothetical protein
MRHLTSAEEIFIASFLLSLLGAIKAACQKPPAEKGGDLPTGPLSDIGRGELAPGTNKVRKEPYFSTSSGVGSLFDKPGSGRGGE